MPTKTINLRDLIERLKSEKIKPDQPLVAFESNGAAFNVFQNSGLNILLGAEGNGKTKFLTELIIKILNTAHEDNPSMPVVLYVDTERPESQYAFTLGHIYDNVEEREFFSRLQLISAIDLKPEQIISAILSFVGMYNQKLVIVIDHILPLVKDMNNSNEASEIDIFFKDLISSGHVILSSIHKPQTGIARGLGHIGSALQRLASNILEIKNNSEGTGFDVTCTKSRIAALNKDVLSLHRDSNGNIDANKIEISAKAQHNIKEVPRKILKKILTEFIEKKEANRKNLIDLVNKEMSYSNKSSSASTFIKNHLGDFIKFSKEGYSLTENGFSLLNEFYD